MRRRQAVADDGPQGRGRGVQGFLRQHEGRAAAGLAGVGVELAKAFCGGVQTLRVACQDDGQTALLGGMADVVAVAGGLDAGARREVGKAKHVAQQGHEEVVDGGVVGVDVAALAQGLEVSPEVLRDLPEAADLVAQLEALGDAVVGVGLLGLVGRLQGGQAGEFVGGDQAAFDADGAVGELMGGAAGHALGPALRREPARRRPSRPPAGWR